MTYLLQIIATAVIWGLLPAGLWLLVQLQRAKRHTARTNLQAQRMRGWRTCVVVTPRTLPTSPQKDIQCTDRHLACYVEYAREEALEQRMRMLARQTEHVHRRRPHTLN